MSDDLGKKIQSEFAESEVVSSNNYRMYIKISSDLLFKVLEYLKNRGFTYLELITCVDWIEEEEFELVYQLGSMESPLRVTVKTRIERNDPRFSTAIPIFKNAQLFEREVHELFGIKFEGNPRLTTLLLDNWQNIPPFRKDFDSREYVKEKFDSIPTLEEYQ